jgi:hypothetical protein
MHTHGNKKIDKRCFRCKFLCQDFVDHVLWCPHGSLARPVFWDKFMAILTSLQTAPYIQHKLLFGISQWQQDGRDSAGPSTIPPYANTVGRLTHLAFFVLNKNNWDGNKPSGAGSAKNGAKPKDATMPNAWSPHTSMGTHG